ncbi:uncharacterized protein LOC107048876 isoform X2 [Diachasma alloeum]|uniref:uncharacterized protein LOC107048876 isoform X2 n=1 Tax=Diachasma alloeum TaxID=454923 RepID=UPI0007382E12|nr:uncharacterized protein LOC107048876 isoform X2 [Diachasma alloeum]
MTVQDKVRVNSCCCRWSLRFGTLFTGFLGIILSIATILLILLADMEIRMVIVDIFSKTVTRIIVIINLFMTIFISSLLIYGAWKKKRFLMLPWIVLGLMIAIGLLISIFYTAISHMINISIWGGVLWLVIGLIVFVIYVYLWVVVLSYHRQLKDDKLKGKIDPYGRPYNYSRA